MSLSPFIYRGHGGRVVFGAGRRAEVGAEAEALGIRRALLVATSPGRWTPQVQQALGDRCAGVFAEAAMHTPVEVTERALALLQQSGADGIVAVGGGSAIGLAKALALRTDLPQIALPSTYAGSEVTDILGQTEGGAKTTLRSPKVLPETVIYDLDLTRSLRAGIAAASGLNALAHAVEALYAPDGNPIVSLMAEEGIRALATGLPHIADGGGDDDARASAVYGAWLCGLCLGATAMSLHHKLCHTLGGMFDLPHAQTHAVILPHAAAYNLPAAKDAAARAARALGGEPVEALWRLARTVGAPGSLRELGMPQDGLDAAADAAVANPYANPRPLERVAARALLGRAWAGDPPAAH